MRRLVARREERIGRSPSAVNDRVMHGRAVALTVGVEQLREQLVELRARDVEIRPLDSAMQRGPHDGNGFGGPFELPQHLSELVVGPRVSERGRNHRGA
jgi:hypothetical protein